MDENGRETEWEVRWRVRTKCEGKGRRYQGRIKKKGEIDFRGFKNAKRGPMW